MFDESREIVRVFAVVSGQKLPVDIRVFPPAEMTEDFRVSDGKTFRVY